MIDVVCDLDGVVHRGSRLIPRADVGLEKLASAGTNTLFATNNSTRTPHEVAAKIHDITGVEVDPSQVVTSAQAAVSTISVSDGAVFVIGEQGIRTALSEAAIEVTENHESAGVVVVGLSRNLSYGLFSDAANAIRDGARFIATNADPTFPTAEGLAPGAGAIVAAVATASGREPEIAGKPHGAMRDLIGARVGPDVWVIGDRVDTDMRMAASETGWKSVLVLSGVTGHGEPGLHADYVVADLDSAVDLVLAGSPRQ